MVRRRGKQKVREEERKVDFWNVAGVKNKEKRKKSKNGSW